MHLDMLLGGDASFMSVKCDLLGSVRPLAEKHGVPLAELGNFETVLERLECEIAAANAVVRVVPIVSAWSRKPF